MAGQGPSPVGEWNVCLQLLYANWKQVTYKGSLSLQFDEEDDSLLVDSVLEAASWIDQLEASILIMLAVAAAILAIPPILDCMRPKGPRGSVQLNADSDSSHTSKNNLLPKKATSSTTGTKSTPAKGKKPKLSAEMSSALKKAGAIATTPSSGTYAPVSNPVSIFIHVPSSHNNLPVLIYFYTFYPRTNLDDVRVKFKQFFIRWPILYITLLYAIS
jgi:hypothetical protein